MESVLADVPVAVHQQFACVPSGQGEFRYPLVWEWIVVVLYVYVLRLHVHVFVRKVTLF